MRGCSTLSPRLGLLNDLRRRFAIEIRVAPDQQTGAENTCVVDPDPCNDILAIRIWCFKIVWANSIHSNCSNTLSRRAIHTASGALLHHFQPILAQQIPPVRQHDVVERAFWRFAQEA